MSRKRCKHRRLHRARRRVLEIVALRIGIAIINPLPRRVVLGLAKLCGTFGYLFDRRGRRIGLANMNLVFGDSKSRMKKHAILHASYITMARTLIDVFWFSAYPEKRLIQYIDLDEEIHLVLRKKNQICITAHLGSWETLGQVMALHGFPLHSVAMPVKNLIIDRLLIQHREVTGQTIIPRKGALRKLLGVLRRKGKIAFLVDHSTSEKEGGIWIDYFGVPVAVTPAPAAIAAKTDSEIVIGFCIPQRGGRYRVYSSKIFSPPSDSKPETIHALMRQILEIIEQEIRTYPEYWLWMYKRWRKIDCPENANRYPFYAK